MKYFRLLLFCSFLFGYTMLAQMPDQTYLNTIDYEELLDLFNQYENDSLSQERIAYTYLNKARKENDTIKVARGYDRLARIFHPQKNIVFADSLIEFTKDWRHITYPAMGYMLKGFEYGRVNSIKDQYTNYNQALLFSERNGNVTQQVFTLDRLVLLRSTWGNVNEAFKLQNRRHNILRSTNYKTSLKNSTRSELHSKLDNMYKEDIIYSYQSYVHCSLKLNAYDMALKYLDTLKNIVKKYSGERNEYNILWNVDASIEIDFFLANYNAVKIKSDSILKQKVLKDYPNFYKNITLFRGLAELKTNNAINSKKYLIVSDSIRDSQENILLNEYDYMLYEGIMEANKKDDDLQMQIYFLDKLLFIDSLRLENYKFLEPELINTYETPRLLKSKELAIDALKQQNYRSKVFVLMVAILLGISLLLAGYYYRQKVLFKRRFELVIQRTETKKAKVSEKNGLDISEEIVEDILRRLNEFELKEGYLDPSITLISLAKKFRTNSSYLSKVLNFHKQTNFPQYLNDHRTNYAVKEIQNNPNFRKYTVEAIASECGYKNSASFSRAFYKNAGIYPSYFISELNKINS